ncbi:hypothetical protein [Archangium violaceum]|uniref:Uncharacterized protein n=1 Tax=Archangium violaceum Cb vi76 TaxID=1406225 RepID=A0A084STL7_9BACT|nr:hypothetical protein [Archangium violaceum]KFA91802.1 hypothetical protein Q664_19610 [Archangium violaceum Cb vi76]WNG53499.1 hypothetical protein F0U59_00875 [Archangium gephyra]
MSNEADPEDRRTPRESRLKQEHRESILGALKQVHERVHEAQPEGASPMLSQGWVDRRRLLLVDLALHLCEEAVKGETVGTRELAEKVHSVLYVAKDLAPGHALEKAAELVLEALGEGDPDAHVD